MSTAALKWMTLVVYNAAFVVALAYAVLLLVDGLLNPEQGALVAAIVLLGCLVALGMTFLVAGLIAVLRFRRVKSRLPNARVYQVTPHENFDTLLAAFAEDMGVRPPLYRPWDVYLIVDEDFVTFLAGSSGLELVSLRRSSTSATVTCLLTWIALIPVVRVSIAGLPAVSLASSVLISGGMVSRGPRFLRRIAEDIGGSQEGGLTR